MNHPFTEFSFFHLDQNWSVIGVKLTQDLTLRTGFHLHCHPSLLITSLISLGFFPHFLSFLYLFSSCCQTVFSSSLLLCSLHFYFPFHLSLFPTVCYPCLLFLSSFPLPFLSYGRKAAHAQGNRINFHSRSIRSPFLWNLTLYHLLGIARAQFPHCPGDTVEQFRVSHGSHV